MSEVAKQGGGDHSLERRLAAANFRPSGFDYMRLVLASGVILQHTVNISYGQPAADALFHSPISFLFTLLMPMFFSLSGFLVAGSLERNRSLISFAGLRAIRLLPALAFEITLSALILGPVLTNFNLTSYFSDPLFKSYFWNFIGYIHYFLPGVFVDNPMARMVNAQLWTLPIELKCYATLALLSVVGIIGRQKILPYLIIIVQSVNFILYFSNFKTNYSGSPAICLISCFLISVCFFRLRRLIFIKIYFVILSLTTVILFSYLQGGYYFIPIPISYLTVYLGTLNPSRNAIMHSGDYSYGIYLYGFPVQQAVATQTWAHQWWINFSLSYPIVFCLAVVSWWVVEKPSMKLKKFIYIFENHMLRHFIFSWHSRRVFLMSGSNELTP